MGKRGPQPTPTKILELRGSWRAKTRPAPVAKMPLKSHAPAWLDAEAKRIWKAKKDLLTSVGLLTELDQMAFARYCALLALWLKLEKFRQEHGEVYEVRDAAGKVTSLTLYLQVTLQLRLSEQLLKLEQSFGLTPASRAHLDVKEPETPPHGNSRAAKDKARFFRLPGQEGF